MDRESLVLLLGQGMSVEKIGKRFDQATWDQCRRTDLVT
jgi:hypothetical protein